MHDRAPACGALGHHSGRSRSNCNARHLMPGLGWRIDEKPGRLGGTMVNARPVRLARIALVSVALVAMGLAPATADAASGPLGHFKHIVVIYEENHSFDNLYGLWGS